MLPKLWWLDIRVGKQRDLDFIKNMPSLRFLSIGTVRVLEDISGIAELTELEFLRMHALPRITEAPSLASLKKLHRVHLGTMKRLPELHGLLDAPNLEELYITKFEQTETDIQLIESHPSLRCLDWHGPPKNLRLRPYADRISHLDLPPHQTPDQWFGVNVMH